LQAGRFELEREPVDARELVEAVLQAHRSAAQARRVRLEAEILPSVESLRADRDRLQVALANLVANAIRHSPEDGHVTVACRAVPDGVRFEVADSGPGIPAEFQARVFERFFRVPGGGSHGSGLGLWIVREIAQAHGGQVGVTSTPGEGSRFWLSLPP
jgi:signal transduction histidine kinase